MAGDSSDRAVKFCKCQPDHWLTEQLSVSFFALRLRKTLYSPSFQALSGDVLMSRLREGRANTARGAAHFLRWC